MRGMETGGSAIEIEVKLAAACREEAVSRLARLGATLAQDRCFEDNEIFDMPDGRLESSDRMLRLRVSGASGIVTFKSKVEIDQTRMVRAKVRAEVQTAVETPAAMRDILLMLGFMPVYRYQKYRSYHAWTDPASGGRLSISLDETPMGVFIELEGDTRAIDSAARRMGWSPEQYIVDDYRTLHRAWLEAKGLPPADMTFDAAP